MEYDSFVAYCHGHFLTNKINQFCMTGSIVLDIVNTIRSLLCIMIVNNCFILHISYWVNTFLFSGSPNNLIAHVKNLS